MRRRYLVTYDVSDDKRRNKIFKSLMDTGDHVQYSVFLCELSELEKARLENALRRVVNRNQDQVLLLDLGKTGRPLDSNHGFEYIGKPYYPPGRLLVV